MAFAALILLTLVLQTFAERRSTAAELLRRAAAVANAHPESNVRSLTIPPSATITSWASGETGSFFTSDGSLCLAATDVPSCAQNATLAYGNDCWCNWNSYWTASASTSAVVCTSYIQTVCSAFYPFTYTSSAFNVTVDRSRQGTETLVVTETEVISDGAFAVATTTSTFTELLTHHQTLTTRTQLATVTGLYTSITTVTSTVKTDAAITPPPCTLPSSVRQCQSSWESYIQTTSLTNLTQPTCQDYDTDPQCASSYAAYQQASQSGDWWGAMLSAYQVNWQYENFGPRCTQASIGSAMCSSIQDRWSAAVGAGNVTAWITSTEHPNWSSAYVTSVWPSSFSYAPGCTVGCSACHITGGSVKLLYWPSQISHVATANDALVTAVVDEMTLTSPTVYISFHEVYASDSCSAIGGTYTSTIVPLTNAADLSSLWGYDFTNTQHLNTASFNYADLNSPVPDSVYNSQPRCAQSAWAFSQTAKSGDEFICPRILPYEPILSIPPEIRALDPAWSQCLGGIEGIYDPPSALQQQTSAAQATLPGLAHTTSASPASTAVPGTPTPTATPAASNAGPTSPTGAPDNLPSPQSQGQTAASSAPSADQHIGSIIASAIGMSAPPGDLAGTPSAPREPATLASIGSAAVQADPANPSAVVIAKPGPAASITLTEGGAPGTVDGQPVSLAASGLIVGTGAQATTIALSAASSSNSNDPSAPGATIAVFTAGSQTLTASDLAAAAASGTPAAVVAGTTLVAGGPALTLADGQSLSLAADGSLVADGTSTLAWTTEALAVSSPLASGSPAAASASPTKSAAAAPRLRVGGCAWALLLLAAGMAVL